LDRGRGSGLLRRWGVWFVVVNLQLLLPGHGGQKRSGSEALATTARRLLPAGCYGDADQALLRAKYMVLFLDTVILGRQGGPSTTSIVEALLRSVRLSRVLLGNALRLGLRVSGILQADTRHRFTDKRGERFTQVRGPR
jgi:hypothetical protein